MFNLTEQFMQNQTLEYYRNNCREFNDSTLKVDFRETQDRFLNELSASASILDFGCGSGRDARYFIEKGYKVLATGEMGIGNTTPSTAIFSVLGDVDPEEITGCTGNH